MRDALGGNQLAAHCRRPIARREWIETGEVVLGVLIRREGIGRVRRRHPNSCPSRAKLTPSLQHAHDPRTHARTHAPRHSPSHVRPPSRHASLPHRLFPAPVLRRALPLSLAQPSPLSLSLYRSWLPSPAGPLARPGLHAGSPAPAEHEEGWGRGRGRRVEGREGVVGLVEDGGID